MRSLPVPPSGAQSRMHMPPLSSDPETHQFSAGMCIRLCYVQITAQITVIWLGPIRSQCRSQRRSP